MVRKQLHVPKRMRASAQLEHLEITITLTKQYRVSHRKTRDILQIETNQRAERFILNNIN